jgi:hypothetical protein
VKKDTKLISEDIKQGTILMTPTQSTVKGTDRVNENLNIR